MSKSTTCSTCRRSKLLYFVSSVFELRPRGYWFPTPADGEYAHAAIIHAISSVDSVAGQRLHDMRRHKRMTCGFVHSRDSGILLRITFMDQDGLHYAHSLLNALSKQLTLRIGSIVCDIVAFDVGNTEWTGVSTWADLLAGTPARSMRFVFNTPTAITKRDTDGGRFMSLYPDPLTVFSGLARRWQALDGPALPDDLRNYLQGGDCVVANYELTTIEFHTTERIQIGFMGHIVYTCLQNNLPYILAFNALARLAFYTGVGYQTARGMGITRTTCS